MDWKSLLKHILDAAPQIHEDTSNENVLPLFKAAQVMACNLLYTGGPASGARVAAGLVMVTYTMKRLVNRSLKNYERERNDGRRVSAAEGGPYASFIDELGSEINKRIDSIYLLAEGITRLVNSMDSVETGKLEAFVDGVSINVRTMEMEIEGCEKKIAFAMEQVKRFNQMTNASDYGYINAGYLCVLSILGPVTSWTVDTLTAVQAYYTPPNDNIERNDELRDEWDVIPGNNCLGMKKRETEFVAVGGKLEKKNRRITLEELYEEANDYIQSVTK